MMDIAHIEALWRLGRLPVDAVETFAVDALMEGYDGPALRELAWPHSSWGEVGDLFAKALEEMGRPPLDRRGAIAQVIRHLAAEIVAGRVPAFEGARDLYYDVCWDFDDWGDYESVADLLRWANVFEDDAERRDEFERKIRHRCQELLDEDPVALSRKLQATGRESIPREHHIDKAQCILLVNEIEPAFQQVWRDFLSDWEGDKPGLCLYLSAFAHFTGDLVLHGASEQVPIILDQIERMLRDGDAEVRDAVATCFLEGLVHRSEVPTRAYIPHLGPESVKYCRAWDEFTGARTEGLWETNDGT